MRRVSVLDVPLLLLAIALAANAQTFVVSLTPSSLTFAGQQTGTVSAAQSVTVKSTGTGSVTFTSFTLTGTDPGDYAISANTCPASLAAGLSCSVSITFNPNATGSLKANLSIADNATGSPQNVALSGTGFSRTLSFTPSSLTFAAQRTGTASTPQTVTVANTGTVSVTFTGFTLAGADPGDYAVTTSTCPVTLTAGSNCAVSIAFSPTANGTRTASLSVADDATGSPQSVPLSGSGFTRTLTFTPSSLTFATQNIGSTSPAQSFTVKNTGDVSTSITGIALTGSNSTDYQLASNSCGATLAAGASCAVGVTFSPTATGTRTAAVTFTDNATGSPQSVGLSGTGQTPVLTLSFSASSLTFGSQNIGSTSAAQSVTITNTGNGAVTFTGFALAGANPGDFAISANTCPTSPATLAVSAACAVSVTFSPTAGGARSASVSVTDNATGSPQSIALSGTGATFTLGFNPTSLTFAPEATGTTSAAQSVTITNTGTSPVSFTSFVPGGANPGDFAISANTCPASPATLASSAACSVSVTFSPTLAGARTASITVTDNATGSPQSIGLSGTGQAPIKTLSFTPPSLTFPPQVTGTQSPAQSVTVKNTGNVTVTFSGIALTGSNPGDYQIVSSTCETTLAVAAGASCSVSITFTPSATGTRSAAVTLTDDATGSPQSVALSGTGQAPTFTLSFSSTSLTFATRNSGTTSAAQSVTITNTGNSPISFAGFVLAGANPGDFAISANTCPASPATLAAGANCSVSATFTPTAGGARTASISITDNATGSPQSIGLSGTGAIYTLSFSSTSLTFTTQNQGTTSSAQSVTITNTGNSPTSFAGFALGGANPGDFAISANTCPASPATLAAGANCSVSATFTPMAGGARAASISVTDNAAGSPQSIGLSGTGAIYTLSFSATSLTFATQNQGTASTAQSVTITNTGNSAVSFTSFALAGANPGDFAISANTCPVSPATLAAGANCSVSATFTPTAGGARAASISVTDNATGSPQSIGLNGTGAIYTLSFTSTSLTFATQNTGTTSAAQSVTVTNTGNSAVSITSFALAGANAGDFAISANTCPVSPATLAASAACTVSATFSPTAGGVRNASISITDNAAGSPQSIGLTGTGQVPVLTLSFNPSSLTFPTVTTGNSSALSFTVQSTGNTAVTISSVAVTDTNASDFAITANTCPVGPSTLAAGASCGLTVTFTPAAAGTRSASVVFSDNTTAGSQSVSLAGTGQLPTSTISFNRTSYSFTPALNIGSTSSTQSFTMTNAGATPAGFNSFTLGGANPGDFAIVGNTCPMMPSTLASGTSCAVSFVFIPTAAGTRTASIIVADNATGTPQTLMISGIGQNPGTTLTFSPTLLTFPTTTIGNTSAQIYTSVSNAGNTPITLTSISITGTNAADFRITNSSGCAISPNVLAAGASCNLYVNFSPSVNGAESASLVFNDSAPGSPQIVPLSGTGQAAAPSLSFNPSVIAFSTVNLGSTTNTYTLIQNTGSAPVTLTSFTITGTNAADFSLNSSTSCAPLPFVVTAGSSCYLYVNFMPSATGSRTGSVQVAYTGSGGSPQTVGLIGSGQSATPFTVSPSTLTFAAQNLTTTSAAQAVNVYNSGGTAVTISSVQVTGANAADFTAVNGCGSSVPAGGHCVVTVTFSPAATGARTATLTLTDSAATSPQNVSLSGTGQANNQTIYISSTALTFAAQNLNTTSGAQSVYVFNNGTGSVTIGGASIAGTNASDFTISNSTCTTLAAGAGCYIFVTFSPTAVGSRVATLQISDTATGSPQSVNLNGTGRSATQTISFSPTILQYATQIVGTSSANQVLAIYNYGNSSMTVNSVTVVGANASEFTIVQNNCTLAVAVPNSYCLVYIAFTPAGIGNRVASIQVSDTAPGSPHSVPLAGTGQNSTSNLNVSSSGLSFGQQVEYTTSSAQYFYLYNVGTSPITISGLSMTGTNAGDFSISQNECPLSPAAIGTNCYIYIQFTPTTTGDEMATLQITDSATGSPHSVQLTGIGIAQTQITSLQPSELNLGSVQLGSSTGATSNYFYIYNKGTTPLTFTSISVVGTNSGDFSFGTTTCPSAPSTLAAGGSCYVYVSFTPQAAGPRTASIQILDSAPDSGVSVSLEGIGLTPATYLSLNPNNLTFAPQFPNTTSASQYFYIYNRGTTPLSLTSETITGTNSGDFSMGTTNCAATIAVNGNCYIYVTFDPLAVGPRTALLQVVDNATGSPQSVSLNGIGQSMIPSIRFDPVNLVFPTETVGTTSGAMYIQINNNGDVAYTLSGISLTGGNSSDFAITSDGCPLSPSMFNPGGLCYVYMTFTPSASGLRTTSLQVSDTLTGSPQLITITGLGSGSSQILQPSVSSIVFPTETIGTQSGASAVTVYNEGNTAITGLAANITGTNAGDFAISSNNCPTPLNPAAGCTIDVTFDPAAVDLRTATLNITGTASNSPQTVTLTGIGQTVTENALDLNQTEMTFGPQNLGTVSGAQGVTIYNYGTGSIAFSGFSITGTNSGDFGISSNNCPANLSAGGGCTVDITFDPSIVGPETATLQIVSNAAGSPQTVSLFGTGQAITEQVYVSQTALAFASQNVNTTSGALSVTVYNEGTGSLTFTGFTIMGTNPGDFTISSNNCPFTLGSTGGCSIFVTFTPAAGGNRSATLQIASNAPGSPQNIELDGDGLLPITTDVLTNTTLAFGAQTDGVTTSGHIDYIYNYGTAPLTINSLAITGPNSADFAITSSTCSSVILAGGSCYFYVAFTPSIVGQESASLIVTDSAADSPTTVNLTGTGQAQTQILAPGSTELTFTALNIGATSAQQGVSVTNYGNTTLTFTGFSITGANAGDFAISQNTCSITLGAGASCTIYVKFTPSVVDVESAALQIADTAVGSPQSVSLFGTGVTPVSQITFSQSSINFGTHNVGTTSAQSSVSVYNYGNTTLSLTGFAVAGTNASEFAIASNTCPSTLTVSSSCTVYLTFTPSATGQQVAYLQVTDTAGGSPQAINLYGTGQ